MSNNPINGIAYFLNGFSLITQSGVRKWVIIPLLINIVLFTVLIYYAVLYFPVELIMEQVQGWLPDWGWLVATMRWLLWPIFIILAVVVVFFTFTFMANLVGGPFNGLLADAVEKHLTGKTAEAPSESLSKTLIGTIKDPIGRLWYYLKWAIVLLIVSFIPVINIASPVLWFLFGAWIFSLEYADAPLGNHGYKAPAQRKMLAQKRMLTLGFGSAVFVTMFIPFVNLLVMPVAVAGMTSIWVQELAESASVISNQ